MNLSLINWSAFPQWKADLHELQQSVRTTPGEKQSIGAVIALMDRLEHDADLAGILPHPHIQPKPSHPFPKGRWTRLPKQSP